MQRIPTDVHEPSQWPGRCIEAAGPWPFVTWRVFETPAGERLVWSSRHHRKRLRLIGINTVLTGIHDVFRSLWIPRSLNWWIGGIFFVGAALFIAGSVLSLWPALAEQWSIAPRTTAGIFFAGSIPFTTAAYLQLFQAANTPPVDPAAPTPPRSWFGWKPKDIGWLSAALQLVGTILFNFNTFDALLPGLKWWYKDLAIWTPNLVGSILFLASGYLAFIETCHAHGAWMPGSISWWVVAVNLFGCVGFMASALTGFFLPWPLPLLARVSLWGTLLGAIGFWLGALLLQIEARLESTAGDAQSSSSA